MMKKLELFDVSSTKTYIDCNLINILKDARIAVNIHFTRRRRRGWRRLTWVSKEITVTISGSNGVTCLEKREIECMKISKL